MSDEYGDIINSEYRKSDRYPRMSLRDRAAQFAPFSALTGYDDVVDEVGRATENRRELDEYEIELINGELQYINENIDDMPFITVIYFVHDKKKSGGAYRTVRDRVEGIDEYDKTIILASGEIVPIEDIFALAVNKR